MNKTGQQFFSNEVAVFDNYLQKTDQKEQVAKIIASGISNLFKQSSKLKVYCIGGGSGEADLKILSLLPNLSFEVENIDPSGKMRKAFKKNAPLYGSHIILQRSYPKNFEDKKLKPNSTDLVLCINSIYFIKGWKEPGINNPLLKLARSLKKQGRGVIVLKSGSGDHFKIKKVLGAGNTHGEKVRRILQSLKIPFYWENVSAKIDISDLYNHGIFSPNDNGLQLLSFLSKGNYKNLPSRKKLQLTKLLDKLKISEGQKFYLNSQYDVIWVWKSSGHKSVVKPDPYWSKKTRNLEKQIRPLIEIVNNFPIKGIYFRDTSKLLRSPHHFQQVIDYVAHIYKKLKVDKIVAKDMQGVLWAGAIGKELGVGIVPIFRKDVAPPILSTTYSHEYNSKRVINLQKQAIENEDRVLIVDYMIATGATVLNTAKLVEHLGGKIIGAFALMELEYLKPRELLSNYLVHSIVKYANPTEN